MMSCRTQTLSSSACTMSSVFVCSSKQHKPCLIAVASGITNCLQAAVLIVVCRVKLPIQHAKVCQLAEGHRLGLDIPACAVVSRRVVEGCRQRSVATKTGRLGVHTPMRLPLIRL